MISMLNDHAALVAALGMTILHSLWQALLLAGLLWSISRFARSARLRYRLAYGTLLLQLALSVLTLTWLYAPATSGASSAGNSTLVLTEFTVTTTGAGWWNPTVFLCWVVVFWVVGLAIGTIRLGVSFGRVRRMQHQVDVAVPETLLATVATLANRLGYRGALNVRISPEVIGPAVLGHFKPLLLFPLALVNQLSPEQAEAVILHELAHLQRQDHWWNLLQCIIEVVFYYHPVVWWIGARIREEREHCCDDLVLQHSPDRLAYAKALLYFENQRATPTTAVALTNHPAGLLGRVKRFLHQQNIPYQMKSRLFLLPLLTLIALISTAVYAPTKAETPPTATEATATALASPTIIAPAAAPQTTLAPVNLASPADSLPSGRHQVTSYRNGKSTKVVVEDRAIKELEINGEVIPPSEFDQHQAMVERMLGTNEGGRNGMIILNGDAWDGEEHPLLRDHLRGLEGLESLRGLESLESLKSLEGLRFLELEGLEDMGQGWEELGNSLELLGEDMGQRLERFFERDGETMRFHWNSEDGESSIFRTDSFPPGFIYRFRSSDDSLFVLDGQVLRAPDAGNKVRELQEMETMIQKLERRKAALQRDLEQSEQDQEQLRMDREKGLMDKERALQGRIRQESRAREEEAQRVRSLESRERQQEAEKRREVAERIRSEERRRVTPDYDQIVARLQEEGLIEGNEALKKLSADEKSLRINGKKASDAAHQRFLELYRGKQGFENPGGKFSLKVNKD